MVGESLRSLLLGEMQITPTADVTLLGPDEAASNRRLNLFLFKVEENAFLKNQDWQLNVAQPTRISPPPLSLNLYYLVTAYAANDQQTGNTPAHEILGEAMRVLYENSIVPETYLADGLKGALEHLKIMQVPLDLEELSQVWGTFKQAFRTSVLYEISVVQLDQAPEAERPLPQRVRQIGIPDVRAPFAPPVVDSLEPLSGPSGTTVTLAGRQLAGWKAYVEISGESLAAGLDLSSDSFNLALPGDLIPGFHQLRVNVSQLFSRTFFFEVTP
jgi:hypothetical protein